MGHRRGLMHQTSLVYCEEGDEDIQAARAVLPANYNRRPHRKDPVLPVPGIPLEELERAHRTLVFNQEYTHRHSQWPVDTSCSCA